MENFRCRIGVAAVAVIAGLLNWAGATLHAAEATSELITSCGGPYQLCGYNDARTGQEIIPKAFERAMPFSQGLAAVQVRGKFGFIDAGGAIAIKPQFELAGEFRHGLAEVVVNDRSNIIDSSGHFIVEPKFNVALPLNPEIVLLSEGPLDKGLKYIRLGRAALGMPPKLGVFSGKTEFRFYRIRHGWLSADRFNFQYFDKPGGDLIWARTEPEWPWTLLGQGRKWGLLRTDGKWIIDPKYERVRPLSDGLAVVTKDGELWGAVDQSGEQVAQLKFKGLTDFTNGFAITRRSRSSEPFSKKRMQNRRLNVLGLGNEGFSREMVGLVDRQGNVVGDRYFDKHITILEKTHPSGAIARVWHDGSW